MAKNRTGNTAYANGQTDPETPINRDVNTDWDAANAVLSKDVSGGDVTLTQSEVQNNGWWEATGTPGVARTINIPDADSPNGWAGERRAAVKNSADADVTFQFVTPGTAVTVPAGGATLVQLENGNVRDILGLFGTVTGPASSTDNALARWNGTAGDAVQDSGWTLDDAGTMTAGGVLAMAGNPVNNAPFALNNQTGTTYTLVAADAGKYLTLDNSSAITVTVPTNASVAFAVGTTVTMLQKGAGQVTISGDTGVTVNNRQGHTKTAGQWAQVSITKIATDTWVLEGDTAA